METVLIYVLKMSTCSAILYGYYRVALYNERFHQWNRFYLLIAMVLSLVVPLLSIPLTANPEDITLVTVMTSMPWYYEASIIANPTIILQRSMLAVAVVVSSVMVVKLLVSIAKLVKVYQSNPVHLLQDNIKLIVTNLTHAPFSFFHWLFWRNDIDPASENGGRILKHEVAHIREYHSIDKLFMSILLCFFWMNPFFWLIRRELNMIHEFLADRKAIDPQEGAAFSEMILHAIPINKYTNISLVNPFYSSQIKRRLHMITTSKSPKNSYLRRISGLAVMICSASALALSIQFSEAQQTVKKKKKAEVSEKAIISDTATEQKNEPFYILEGKEVEPRKIKDIDAQDIESVNVLKGAEATEKYGSKGKNGVVLIALKPSKKQRPAKQKIVITPVSKSPYLTYVDSKLIKTEDMAKIDSKDIESVNVLKGESAIKKYGQKGKDGVVEIMLKKSTP